MKKLVLPLILMLCLSVSAGCGRSLSPAGSSASSEVFSSHKEPSTTEETTEETTFIPKDIAVGDVVIPGTAEEADISGRDVKALGIDMGKVLDSLPNLKRIYMIGCGLNNAEYAKLQDDHPNIKIVWEVDLTYWRVRTDAVAFSTFNYVGQGYWMTNAEAYYLKYCTDMVALDIGHNRVTDVSFLQYMPNLKVLILVDNMKVDEYGNYIGYLSDLSVLKHCPKLRYLEFFVSDVSDLSFLQYCREIEDLNVCYCNITSVEYLMDLPRLQRLWIEGNWDLPYEEFAKLIPIYPNATLVYYGSGSIDQGWREGDHYWAMRNMVTNNVIDPIYAD